MYSTSAQSEDGDEVPRINCHVPGCLSRFEIYKSYLEHCERRHDEKAWARAVRKRTPGHAEFRCPKAGFQKFKASSDWLIFVIKWT